MELTMMTRRERPSNDPRRWVDEHGHEIEESDRGLVYDSRPWSTGARSSGCSVG
jgi:hypothetical protein